MKAIISGFNLVTEVVVETELLRSFEGISSWGPSQDTYECAWGLRKLFWNYSSSSPSSPSVIVQHEQHLNKCIVFRIMRLSWIGTLVSHGNIAILDVNFKDE